MNREELDKWNELFDAVNSGKNIEFRKSGGPWKVIDYPMFNADVECYRVDPLPRHLYANVYKDTIGIHATLEKAEELSSPDVIEAGVKYVRARV